MRSVRGFAVALVAAATLQMPLAITAAGTPPGSAPTIVAIAAGGMHTCALTAAGGVLCWGENGDGQLGDGTDTEHRTPVQVVGLATGVKAVSAGMWHTCALTSTGGVKCWGDNLGGGLGDGTETSRSMPVDVTGLTSGVTAISAGSGHTCALTDAGGVKCWGWNGSGQVGDGTTDDRLTAVGVHGLASGVAAISAGGSLTCALTTAGGVKCWGFGAASRPGDSQRTDSAVPADVPGLASGVADVSAGQDFACAVTTSGGAKCWGRNTSGGLGDGTTTDRFAPVDVVGLASGVATIGAGAYHTCALTTVGGVKCWGANYSNELGDGTDVDRLTPVDVVGIAAGATTLDVGGIHACALVRADGTRCWGRNDRGQLGDGTNDEHRTPVQVVFGPTTGGGTAVAWSAKLGARGANGTATLSVTGSNGILRLALKSLARSAAYPVTIVKGTCAKPGTTLWAVPSQKSTPGGSITRNLPVPSSKVAIVHAAAASGPMSIRVGAGSRLRCGALAMVPATSPASPTSTPTLAP